MNNLKDTNKKPQQSNEEQECFFYMNNDGDGGELGKNLANLEQGQANESTRKQSSTLTNKLQDDKYKGNESRTEINKDKIKNEIQEQKPLT